MGELAPSLRPGELDTLKREAWEAFEYAAPRGKTDSTGRIWTFEPNESAGVFSVDLRIHRPGSEGFTITLRAPWREFRDLRPQFDAAIERLNEAPL